MAGIPVITNPLGDLKLYLIDGKNGFVINSIKLHDIIKIIRKSIIIDESIYYSMSNYSNKFAEKTFSPNKYKSKFLLFLERIIND